MVKFITPENLLALYKVFNRDIYFDGLQFSDIKDGRIVLPFKVAYSLVRNELATLTYNTFYAKRLLEPTQLAGCFYQKLQNYIVNQLQMKEEDFFRNIRDYLDDEKVQLLERFWKECKNAKRYRNN